MRLAVYHNLPYGGAIRVMREQINRMGSDIERIYTFGNTTNRGEDDDPRAVNYTISLRGQLGRPFGRLNPIVTLANLKSMKAACRRIANEIDAQGYDAVLVHPCFITQTPPILRFLRTPALYYCHEYLRSIHDVPIRGSVISSAGEFLHQAFIRAAVANEYEGLKCSAQVLCNSFYVRESVLSTYGVDARVNYPGIDSGLFKYSDAPRDNSIVSVGALAPFKGHEFVIESISLIPPKKRPRLTIVCGRYKLEGSSSVQKMCAGLGVEVEIITDASDEKLVEVYGRSIATAYAPILEPLGLVPLESMACGTPVVAVAEAGIRETVVDGVTGILTPRSRQAFADALVSIIDNPESGLQMGKAGRSVVEKQWNWEKSIAQLRASIEEVCGK